MTKWLLDIDDDLLAKAQEILGTTSDDETVARALSEVVRHQRHDQSEQDD